MRINYVFKNESLLTNALTHSSYSNENRSKGIRNNERLEFLGDSVLGFIAADFIFRSFFSLPEGEMTKLRAAIVCEGALCEYAEMIDLGKDLLLGRGEKAGGGQQRPSLLADAFEAVIAAIYLDGGLEPARDFVLPFIEKKAADVLDNKTAGDYKTTLQEIVQKNHQETLSYKLIEESGPGHNRHFVVEVYINSNPVARGEGHSKKTAEQAAAKAALELMGQ